jgi:hypothetical protein
VVATRAVDVGGDQPTDALRIRGPGHVQGCSVGGQDPIELAQADAGLDVGDLPAGPVGVVAHGRVVVAVEGEQEVIAEGGGVEAVPRSHHAHLLGTGDQPADLFLARRLGVAMGAAVEHAVPVDPRSPPVPPFVQHLASPGEDEHGAVGDVDRPGAHDPTSHR